MPETDAPIRVLFLHGLESGPLGTKVLAMRAAGLEVHAPQLDAAPTAALLRDGALEPAALLRALETPRKQALEALLEQRPDVVVGSSFGAAVLMLILESAEYTGAPAVMLAGAAVKLTGHTALPASTRVLLVHGRDDVVVPIEDSRLLAASSKHAILVEVHDDHRLTRTTESGLLTSLVRLTARGVTDEHRVAVEPTG